MDNVDGGLTTSIHTLRENRY